MAVSAGSSREMDGALRAALAAHGWRPERLLKDDSVSEVWTLEGERGRALLKRARSGRWLAGLPPRWLARREIAILRALEGIPGVPRVLVRLDGATYVREFVEGRPLRAVQSVDDDFFARLLDVLARVHARHVACVDLSKRDNILVGADGAPALMDFQAALLLRTRLCAPLLRVFQRGDVYHVYKHQRRAFPAAPIPPPPPFVARRPPAVRAHEWLLRRPYLALKRRLVGRSDPLAVRPLDASRRADFLRLHGAADGGPWCHCVAWWVAGWDGWGERAAQQNAALRDGLFARGVHDGYLLYEDDEPIGWCQAAQRDALPGLVHDFGERGEPDTWAITCLFVRPDRRRRGSARRLLEGVLAALAERGARRVEAFPRNEGDEAGELWTGPRALFEELGFELVERGERRSVVARELT